VGAAEKEAFYDAWGKNFALAFSSRNSNFLTGFARTEKKNGKLTLTKDAMDGLHFYFSSLSRLAR